MARKHRVKERIRADPLLRMQTEESETPPASIHRISPIPSRHRKLAKAKNQAAQNLKARLIHTKSTVAAEDKIDKPAT